MLKQTKLQRNFQEPPKEIPELVLEDVPKKEIPEMVLEDVPKKEIPEMVLEDVVAAGKNLSMNANVTISKAPNQDYVDAIKLELEANIKDNPDLYSDTFKEALSNLEPSNLQNFNELAYDEAKRIEFNIKSLKNGKIVNGIEDRKGGKETQYEYAKVADIGKEAKNALVPEGEKNSLIQEMSKAQTGLVDVNRRISNNIQADFQAQKTAMSIK